MILDEYVSWKWDNYFCYFIGEYGVDRILVFDTESSWDNLVKY